MDADEEACGGDREQEDAEPADTVEFEIWKLSLLTTLTAKEGRDLVTGGLILRVGEEDRGDGSRVAEEGYAVDGEPGCTGVGIRGVNLS